jgi:hypothetical protein
MTTIDVTCDPAADGWSCRVRVTDAGGSSEHEVGVGRGDLERLEPGATAPDDLVRRSFEFLLEREPRTSILRSFDLPVIGRYFPEYEHTIRRQRNRRH